VRCKDSNDVLDTALSTQHETERTGTVPAKEAEVRGGTRNQHDCGIHTIKCDEVQISDQNVGDVGEAMHAHHWAQPLLLLIDYRAQREGHEKLHKPQEHEGPDNDGDVCVGRGLVPRHVFEAEQECCVLLSCRTPVITHNKSLILFSGEGTGVAVAAAAGGLRSTEPWLYD
jgi:hypothetical protein